MMDSTYRSNEPPADQLRETLIAREERRRREAAKHQREFVPDYPTAFSEEELRVLRAAPDPIAIPIYALIFERMDDWRHLHHLLDACAVCARFRAAGLRCADWQERHARTEAALAYLLDTGLVVPGIDCAPFKFGARWWMDRLWRARDLSAAEIARESALWRRQQLYVMTWPETWALQIDARGAAFRRDHDAEAPMAWRLLRRLPAYAHLPAEHPPRGETYAEARRRHRQERARAA
jgi:hypothetical protein